VIHNLIGIIAALQWYDGPYQHMEVVVYLQGNQSRANLDHYLLQSSTQKDPWAVFTIVFYLVRGICVSTASWIGNYLVEKIPDGKGLVNSKPTSDG